MSVQFGSGFIIGTDQVSVSIFDQQNNVLVQLDGKRSMFESKAKETLLESEVMDEGGLVDSRVSKEGYTGTIEVEKQNAAFSQFMANNDADFYAGNPQDYYTMIVTINLPPINGVDQGTEVETYTNVVFHSYEPPTYKKKEKAMTRVQFKAQQRFVVQGA